MLHRLLSRYENIENIDILTQEILTGKKQKGTEIKTNLKNIDAEIRKINQEINLFSQAIFAGADKSIFVPKSKEPAEKLKKCESKKEYFLDEEKIKNKIDTNKISEFFLNFQNVKKPMIFSRNNFNCFLECCKLVLF